MTQQGSLAELVSRSESSGRAASAAEPVVKEDSRPRTLAATSRVISDPASLQSDPASFQIPPAQRKARPQGKSAQRQSSQEVASYVAFRRLSDDIYKEIERIGVFFVADEVSEKGAEVVAEIEVLLEQLYACPYGQGESLKRVVVAVQSQVNNAQWNRRHVEFLRDVVRYLRARYHVDEAAVDACYVMMKERGLDPFRGTVGAPRVVKRYRIEEVKENAESTGSNS